MRFLPDDARERWNRLVAYGVIAFGVWIAVIVVGQVTGKNRDVQDDAALIIAVGGLLALLLGQVHHAAEQADTKAKVDEVYRTVNDVTDGESVGTMLRSLAEKVDALAARVDRLEPAGSTATPAGTSVTKRTTPAKPRKRSS